MKLCRSHRSIYPWAMLVLVVPGLAGQQKNAGVPAAVRSAPITNIRYELTFDSASAA